MDEAIQPINVQSAKQKIKSYSHNPGSLILAVLVGLAALPIQHCRKPIWRLVSPLSSRLRDRKSVV